MRTSQEYSRELVYVSDWHCSAILIISKRRLFGFYQQTTIYPIPPPLARQLFPLLLSYLQFASALALACSACRDSFSAMIPQAFFTAAVAILTILSNGASALEDTKHKCFIDIWKQEGDWTRGRESLYLSVAKNPGESYWFKQGLLGASFTLITIDDDCDASLRFGKMPPRFFFEGRENSMYGLTGHKLIGEINYQKRHPFQNTR